MYVIRIKSDEKSNQGQEKKYIIDNSDIKVKHDYRKFMRKAKISQYYQTLLKDQYMKVGKLFAGKIGNNNQTFD